MIHWMNMSQNKFMRDWNGDLMEKVLPPDCLTQDKIIMWMDLNIQIR